MGLTVQQFTRLKEQVESLRRQADREAGALDQMKQRLKEEFGCSSFARAKKKLDRMEKEEARLEQEFEEVLEPFEQEMKKHG